MTTTAKPDSNLKVVHVDPTLPPDQINDPRNVALVLPAIALFLEVATVAERRVLLGLTCPSGHESTTETCPACAPQRSRTLGVVAWRWTQMEEQADSGLAGGVTG
jgi:hypothetical protein